MNEETSVRDVLIKLELSNYLGMSCKFCGKVFETFEDLNVAVRADNTLPLTIAHKACYDKQQVQTNGI